MLNIGKYFLFIIYFRCLLQQTCQKDVELGEFCRVFLVLFGVLSHLWSSERPLPDPPFTAQRPSAHPVLLPV